jgi:hypothetical protein
MDPAQSYPLRCSRFANATLSSPLLLRSPPIDVPAPESTKLVARRRRDSIATRAVLKMCNRRRARQRIQWTADGSMTVGPMAHLLLSQSGLNPRRSSSVAAQPLVRCHPPLGTPRIELRASIELRVDEPLFVQSTSRCYAETACCKPMFQVFQMFHRYVIECFIWML